MTTQSRIALFLSTSALCLGLANAPAAGAASQSAAGATTSSLQSAKPAAASKPTRKRTEQQARKANARAGHQG
jgi:hypothetical protein